MDFFSPVEEETYGIDEEGPETLEDPPGTVEVPEVSFQLNTINFQSLCDSIDPLAPSDNFGIDLYENVLDFTCNI